MKPTLAALSIAAAAALAAPTYAADLSLAFQGIETPKGALMIAVYDNEAGYEGGQSVRAVKLQVTTNTASVVVRDLAPGRYAFKLFHDVDSDGKMKTNPFGIPTEPYAFSNNAPASMGPAKWVKAAFDLPASGAAQTITVR